MAKDYNKIVLTGRLGGGREGKAPVDLRFTGTGTPVASFSVASGRNIRDANEPTGWREETEWFNVVVYNELAERLEKQLAKGTHVLVEGRVQTRKWTDRDGNPRYTTEVVASDVVLLSNKAERDRLAGSASSDMGEEDELDDSPAPAPSRQAPASTPVRKPAPAPAASNGSSNYRAGNNAAPARSTGRGIREETRVPIDDGMEPDDIPF